MRYFHCVVIGFLLCTTLSAQDTAWDFSVSIDLYQRDILGKHSRFLLQGMRNNITYYAGIQLTTLHGNGGYIVEEEHPTKELLYLKRLYAAASSSAMPVVGLRYNFSIPSSQARWSTFAEFFAGNMQEELDPFDCTMEGVILTGTTEDFCYLHYANDMNQVQRVQVYGTNFGFRINWEWSKSFEVVGYGGGSLLVVPNSLGFPAGSERYTLIKLRPLYGLGLQYNFHYL